MTMDWTMTLALVVAMILVVYLVAVRGFDHEILCRLWRIRSAHQHIVWATDIARERQSIPAQVERDDLFLECQHDAVSAGAVADRDSRGSPNPCRPTRAKRDRVGDRLRQRAGIADAGGAAVAHEVEPERIEVLGQSRLVVVLRDDRLAAVGHAVLAQEAWREIRGDHLQRSQGGALDGRHAQALLLQRVLLVQRVLWKYKIF